MNLHDLTTSLLGFITGSFLAWGFSWKRSTSLYSLQEDELIRMKDQLAKALRTGAASANDAEKMEDVRKLLHFIEQVRIKQPQATPARSSSQRREL